MEKVSLVTFEDVKRLIEALPEEEKEQLLAEELEALPPEVRARILQRQLPALIVSYGQGSTINNNSYQVNEADPATALELLIKLRQLRC